MLHIILQSAYLWYIYMYHVKRGWLVQVARYWRLRNTTLHLAVDLLDRFLFTVSKFDLDKFVVLALSCLHLAANHRGNQIHNHRHDATADMMHLTRNEFIAYDFELAEEKVVCHLQQCIDVDIAVSHIRGANSLAVADSGSHICSHCTSASCL